LRVKAVELRTAEIAADIVPQIAEEVLLPATEVVFRATAVAKILHRRGVKVDAKAAVHAGVDEAIP
jgi:hypothetical protein